MVENNRGRPSKLNSASTYTCTGEHTCACTLTPYLRFNMVEMSNIPNWHISLTLFLFNSQPRLFESKPELFQCVHGKAETILKNKEDK